MIEFVSDREIQERVVCGLVPAGLVERGVEVRLDHAKEPGRPPRQAAPRWRLRLVFCRGAGYKGAWIGSARARSG